MEEKSSLQDHIQEFYQGLLGTKTDVQAIPYEALDRGLKVSLREGTKLLMSVTDMKVKTALWSITGKKSPGLDGFSSGFYKAAWPSIGDSICEAVKEFF